MLEPSVEKDWCLPLTGFDHFADIEGSRAIATADSKGDNLSPINNNIVAFQKLMSAVTVHQKVPSNVCNSPIVLALANFSTSQSAKQ